MFAQDFYFFIDNCLSQFTGGQFFAHLDHGSNINTSHARTYRPGAATTSPLPAGGDMAIRSRWVGGRVRNALVASLYFGDSEATVVQDFSRRYTATFHEQPDSFSAGAYDAANLVLIQLAKGLITRDGVRDGVLVLTDMKSGLIRSLYRKADGSGAFSGGPTTESPLNGSSSSNTVPDSTPAAELSRILPWQSRLSWNTLTNVFVQAQLQRSASSSEKALKTVRTKTLPKLGFEQMLRGLRRWIAGMVPRSDGKSEWQDYTQDNSYADGEASQKRQFVADFVATAKPGLIFDLGCNTGDYSALALKSGARVSVGFDLDHGVLDYAYDRARRESLNFLPLHLDAANPSPEQGWLQAERQGVVRRARGDAVLALALVHHLVIARNIPLDGVLDWITGIAPCGVIEFVPKTDPMVQRLLQLRQDLFDDYGQENFESLLAARANIVKSQTVSSSGRTLYHYERHA